MSCQQQDRWINRDFDMTLTLLELLPELALEHTLSFFTVQDLAWFARVGKEWHRHVGKEFERRDHATPSEQKATYSTARQRVIAFELARESALKMQQLADSSLQDTTAASPSPAPCTAKLPDLLRSRDLVYPTQQFFALFTIPDHGVVWQGFLPRYDGSPQGPIIQFLRTHNNWHTDLLEFQLHFIAYTYFQLHLDMRRASLSENHIRNNLLRLTLVDFQFARRSGIPPRCHLVVSACGFQRRQAGSSSSMDATTCDDYEGAFHIFQDQPLQSHSIITGGTSTYVTPFLFWSTNSPQVTSLTILHTADSENDDDNGPDQDQT